MNSPHHSMPLNHGGDLTAAIKKYGNHPDGWLEMSTGISPWSWPISRIDQAMWESLPPPTDSLLAAAADYYQTSAEHITVAPGSQLAIRLIPRLLPVSTVAVPALGYQEHAHSWLLAGHRTIIYRNFSHLEQLLSSNDVEHAVVINPNNPTGEIASPPQLNRLSELTKGYVLIDEAFADAPLDTSAVALQKTNIIVLRSLGKFFGLAGLRIGFVITYNELTYTLKTIFEPWSLSGPSMHIAEHALRDKMWQRQQVKRIQTQSQRFNPVLLTLKERLGLRSYVNSGLFHTFTGQKSAIDQLHNELARVGIWSRLYNQNDSTYWLRLSLAENVEDVERRTLKI